MKYFEVLYLDSLNYVKNKIVASRDDKSPSVNDNNFRYAYTKCKKILAFCETDDMAFHLDEQKYFKLK